MGDLGGAPARQAFLCGCQATAHRLQLLDEGFLTLGFVVHRMGPAPGSSPSGLNPFKAYADRLALFTAWAD
jgi:hypothetical protein